MAGSGIEPLALESEALPTALSGLEQFTGCVLHILADLFLVIIIKESEYTLIYFTIIFKGNN